MLDTHIHTSTRTFTRFQTFKLIVWHILTHRHFQETTQLRYMFKVTWLINWIERFHILSNITDARARAHTQVFTTIYILNYMVDRRAHTLHDSIHLKLHGWDKYIDTRFHKAYGFHIHTPVLITVLILNITHTETYIYILTLTYSFLRLTPFICFFLFSTRSLSPLPSLSRSEI